MAEIRTFDLSLGQKELWFIHAMGGAARSAYNESVIFSLQGQLNIDVLKNALTAIIKRHAILRTSFNKDDEGQLFQQVHSEALLNFKCLEMTKESVSDAIRQELNTPFMLETAPLMRVTLIKRGEDDYILMIVIHHIIIDGTSFGILIHDLNQYYNAALSGNALEVNASQVSFYDHVLLEQSYLSQAEYQEHVDKTAEQLQGYSGLNFLTTPIGGEEIDIFSGNRAYFKLDSELSIQLNEFARANRATMFHVLYAAYSLLIRQYARSNDILIGVPFANRSSQQEKEIMGYFVNTLPMRLQLNDEDSFLALVNNVKTLVFTHLARQHVAFEHIAPKLNLERKGLGQHPMIQTMFVWGNTDKLQLSLDGVSSQLMQGYSSNTAKFDLSLFMLEQQNEGITGYFEYRDALFDKEIIERFAQGFVILLKNILNNPSGMVSSFSLLDAAEKESMKQKLFTANLTRTVTQSLADLFSASAAKYSKNIGLVFGDRRYNYATIEQKSNQWASYIRHTYSRIYGQELPADTLVALCVDRHEDMIFGMLGILKAGAAYVPVDPQYPSERINYIISHSKAALLLTHKVHDELTLEFPSERTIYMDDEAIYQDKAFLEVNLSHRVSPKDIAYVLYTSGSTGKPKGVAVTHENVNCLFASLDKVFDLSSQDVWSLFHTFCFDISVWEIWGAFLYGGTLLVIPYEVTRDTSRFYELIAKEKVSVLTQTASAFQMFINEDARHPQRLDHLRYVGFVGESLKVSILRPWVEKYGTEKPRLANLYGITETTVYTNYKFVEQSDIDKGRDNIGWPLEEFSMCVLDTNNEWCPMGIVGEICIGGRGLSRGYLYRDDLTKERFFPDPYAEFLGLPEGALLYRTGDLGRWMEDGSIEYLGRKDFQIKLRGFRIELGEIEAALGSYEGISHTVVLLKGEGETAYLAAYYTVMPGYVIDANNLRAHLKSFLPEYMVPTVLSALSSFPMTVNGKIDRKVLHAYADTFNQEKSITPLTSTIEVEIATIWSAILKIDISAIGSTSNFFELGGNSLLVVKMLTQVSNKLGVDFALSRFIAVPTIATLARQMDQSADSTQAINAFCARLKKDCELDADIQPLDEANLNLVNPRAILITGVTGFLGAHMLQELLEKTDADIYCVVRAATPEQGLQNIIKRQEYFRLYNPDYRARIFPVLGDLSKIQLGLSSTDFTFLANEIDWIMHVGAWVHHVYDYETLYHANVQSVIEALRLAVTGKNKALHFVSTLATGSISPLERLPTIDLNSPEAQLNFNGYLTTKWVSEQLLQEAYKRGILAYVYRPGNIIAGSKAVYEPENNHTLLRLKGMLQLKKAFVNPTETVEMMPVDLLAKAIVKLAFKPELFIYTLNNINTMTWLEYLQQAKSFGFDLELLEDEAQWLDILTHLDEHNAFYKLAQYYNNKTTESARETQPYVIPNYWIETPSYQDMIGQQLEALVASGFLEDPATEFVS